MHPSKKNGLLEVSARPVNMININMNPGSLVRYPEKVDEALLAEDIIDTSFLRTLAAELTKPLPGREAQGRMAPRPRPGFEADFQPSVPPRQGGVLILLYPHEGEFHLPLILRPTYNGVHSGQVGFPGGGREAVDVDITATALRECYEEIGVRTQDVRVIGQLSKLYIRPSNYEVTPTVGWTTRRPDFSIDPHEVASLLEIRLSDLQDPCNCHEEEWQLRDRRARVPFFRLSGQTIWGATAMMLSELLSVIDRCERR